MIAVTDARFCQIGAEPVGDDAADFRTVVEYGEAHALFRCRMIDHPASQNRSIDRFEIAGQLD